jgi:hypothetical protein
MTLEELQHRLREAHARIGFEGRFAFTIDQSAGLEARDQRGGCYITHWFRPTPYAFEDCKAVGSGSVADCIAALDRYTDAYADDKDVLPPIWQPTIATRKITALLEVQ